MEGVEEKYLDFVMYGSRSERREGFVLAVAWH